MEGAGLVLSHFYKVVHHNFGNIAFVAIFIVIAAAGQFAFYCHFIAFFQIFFGKLCFSVPKYQAMPLGIGYFFAFIILITIAGGYLYTGQFTVVIK